MKLAVSEEFFENFALKVVSGGAKLESPIEAADPLNIGALAGDYFAVRDGNQLLRRTSNGVGLISITGTLSYELDWFYQYYGGGTTYPSIAAQVAEARADDDIVAVAYNVNSNGGGVLGCDDLATEMRVLTSEKPTMAICAYSAYSAAYWLAAQCGSIVVPEAGGVGSIGTIWTHQNIKEYLKKIGVDISILKAGEHKDDRNPYEPLPDDVRNKLDGQLEVVRQQFARAVAAGRGKQLTAKQALATEAECFDGPLAVEAGLADDVASPTEAYESFVSLF